MLMNMESLLQTARKHHFAVGAFNVCDSLLFSTVMECAEEQHAPVIVELAPPEFSYVGSDFFAYAVKRMQNSSVPCVLHLDHGKTIQDCIRAIRCGFTSVMIDGSLLAYEDNVKLTKTVVELAHGVDVSVEGEIGTIGALSDSVEGGVEQVTYTKPEEVKAIEKVNTCPLVLHGGSANRDEEIAEACRHGICKVNIASDVRKAFFQGTKEMLIETDAFWTPDVFVSGKREAKRVITHKMQLFGCIGQADKYR